jgi:hypothetical protein
MSNIQKIWIPHVSQRLSGERPSITVAEYVPIRQNVNRLDQKKTSSFVFHMIRSIAAPRLAFLK